MIQAIYVHNNGFDTVVVRDGTALMVTREVVQHFLEAQHNGDDFSEWHGTMDWPTDLHDIWEVAEAFGDVVAYYEDGRLHVQNAKLWEERKTFWGVA